MQLLPHPSKRLGSRRGRTGLVEPLESRTLLNATLTSGIGTITTAQNSSPTTIDLTQHFSDPAITGTTVVMHTTQGDIPVMLFDSRTPQTVANFLSLTNTGSYDNTVIHRAIPGFLVQGGSYLPDQSSIQSPKVPSEAGISNTVGTIAAALFNGGPGTATSGWFINDGNNATALDGSQDGGPFTVFGTVVYNGMQVVNRIANLPKGSVPPTFTPDTTLGDPSSGVLPLQNYSGGTISPSNYVTIPSVQVVPSLAFSATSDNTALVTPSVSNGVLTLNYQPGQTGIANITVNATDLGGNTLSTVFKVALGDVLGPGGARQIRFTDADGTRTILSLIGPGNANVQFNGTGITESLSKAGIRTVSGSGLSIAGISLTGTTGASALNVTGVGGNGLVEIGSLTADGDLRAINAVRGALSGDLTIAGSVSRIALASATGGTITVGGAAEPLVLAIPSAAGEAVNSAEPIALLQSASWTANGSTPSPFAAPSIGRIFSPREFDAQVTASSVGFAFVGAINSSSWTIGGPVTAINAASISGLTLAAASVGRIVDRGAATSLNVNSAGAIGSVFATSLTGSNIFAGQATYPPIAPGAPVYQSLPTGFSTSAPIGIVRIGFGGFNNSTIGAASLGSVILGPVTTASGGGVFGIAAQQLSLLIATIDGKRLVLRRPASQSDVDAAVTKAGITLNNLQIQIV